MAFFPLYQEFGNAVQYFSYDQGFAAGQAACAAAEKSGIPAGTVLYFSVDFDAIDSEITSYIIPHFRGVADAVYGNPTNFAIGVYGCRNVGIRLDKAGLTSRSFVSGMSTGYSGNLGFPLPDNWAFDQIQNYTVPSGTGTLELDKDIASGRDVGVNSVSRPRDPNDTFYTYLIWLEARAQQYRDAGHTAHSRADLVGQWLRLLDPVNNISVLGLDISNQVFGEFDQGFIDFVSGYAGRPDLLPPRDPAYLWDSKPSHFGASFGAVLVHGFATDRSLATITDFGAWGGDLLSVLGQVYQNGVSESQAYAYASSLLATTASNSYFDRSNFFADVDAVVMGVSARSDSSLLLSDLFKSNYASASVAKLRFQTFVTVRFNGSLDTLSAAADSMFGDMAGGTATSIRDGFWFKDFGGPTCPSPSFVSAGIRSEVVRAWVSCVVKFANN
jgi:peptidoglycan hydrolase-like protein with peptidoglycan-binding domain